MLAFDAKDQIVSVPFIGMEMQYAQITAPNIVADFPLCNKSFNCSYSGHDL
jgi:hypothetical protein